jgi:heat shock protein HslJ
VQLARGGGTIETARDPSRYTLTLGPDGRYTILADCNRVVGSYTLQGSQLTIAPGPSTLMACPPDSQADAFLKDLMSAASYALSGENLLLTLASNGGTMTFAAAQPVALAGSSWDLLAYNNGRQAVVSLLPGTQISTTFDADGSIGGSAG